MKIVIIVRLDNVSRMMYNIIGALENKRRYMNDIRNITFLRGYIFNNCGIRSPELEKVNINHVRNQKQKGVMRCARFCLFNYRLSVPSDYMSYYRGVENERRAIYIRCNCRYSDVFSYNVRGIQLNRLIIMRRG